MQYRPFGKTDLVVSEIGFGCASIGGVFQSSSRKQILHLLRQAADEGITFFDTADMYTQGESERLVGEAFSRGDRQQVVIATKVGFKLPAQKQLIARIKPLVKPLITRLGLRPRQLRAGLRGTVSEQDFSPAYLISALESSLKRLNTDYVDVYQLHSPPIDVLRTGAFVEPLETLRKQGKIRAWGVACEQPDDVLACLQFAPLGAVQVALNVLEQVALDAAIPAAAERGLAIIARQVFASGLVTRPLTAIRDEDLDRDVEVAERKRQQLVEYASIAERSGRSQAAMALKFALAWPGVSVVLLGISRPDQLAAGVQALAAAELTPDERQLLLTSRRSGR